MNGPIPRPRGRTTVCAPAFSALESSAPGRAQRRSVLWAASRQLSRRGMASPSGFRLESPAKREEMSSNARPSEVASHDHDQAAARPRGFLRTWVLDFHNRTVLFRAGNWLFTTYAFLAGAEIGRAHV